MAVPRGLVLMNMGMAAGERRNMTVRVVAILVGVSMLVLMQERHMLVRVLMMLGQMQPDSEPHQNCGGAQWPCQRFPKQSH